MRRWVGRSLVAVGVLHVGYGLFAYRAAVMAVVGDGVVGAVDADPERARMFWFLVAGLLTALFGAMTDWLERRGTPPPRAPSLGFALLALACIAALPESGAWLLAPPAAALLARAWSRHRG